MSRLIKKYKNRRLYDTETSQYITLEQLQTYVTEGIEFKVEDSETAKDLTNAILLQIIVEMEAGPTQFLSSDILRQIITLANHPMQVSFKSMMEDLFQAMNKPLQSNPYQQVSKQWNEQMQEMMQQWQKLFKK
ncbi:polyhydroxyalkanoate synthesis regulator DNA-binding domain-containing protein [Legionella sp. km772]|uniref:polyhydroxyalkanoate synthesis regulator DNA-binding domain-containing protein n=1 Tax=Legionella sp. km772 TaxID=2498111 RepID=UPI000F8F2D6F|nr:polyhydroxyalkanoate synthesis regulator DNA-binding domain-containing protein [Legionella sp. km772]RUR08673.1 polyhydroxyalkanoate biosynthesis repressor PhaR [Legionella sp. km772]